MDFRTSIQLNQERNQIDYASELMLVGSCFSENIHKKLSYCKFNSFSNPFGILYNPIAIEKLITNAINEKKYSEKDLFNLNERWHCFDAHSDLSSGNKSDALENLNNTIETSYNKLKSASHLIITLGTAWVYRYIESDVIVGNCHKIPQKKFLKELLSIEDIVASLENILALMNSLNSNINVIFTVSPVRHLKDGFVENSQSKAHLLAAIHKIKDKRKNIHYFPSYEIMLDDLRDYRFYAEDMVHPNSTAIDYIWTQFQKVWVSETSIPLMKEIETIQKGLAHKPFNQNSEQHQSFLKNLQAKILKLEQNHSIRFD